jgi:hypothetical protein
MKKLLTILLVFAVALSSVYALYDMNTSNDTGYSPKEVCTDGNPLDSSFNVKIHGTIPIKAYTFCSTYGGSQVALNAENEIGNFDLTSAEYTKKFRLNLKDGSFYNPIVAKVKVTSGKFLNSCNNVSKVPTFIIPDGSNYTHDSTTNIWRFTKTIPISTVPNDFEIAAFQIGWVKTDFVAPGNYIANVGIDVTYD